MLLWAEQLTIFNYFHYCDHSVVRIIQNVAVNHYRSSELVRHKANLETSLLAASHIIFIL